MSCNKEQFKRLSTITITSHQNGRVGGRLTRLSGSSGYLTAVSDRGYKFDGWYYENGDLLSEDAQLYIPGWMDMSLEARFSDIIITSAQATAMDGGDGLVYFLEKH